MPGKFSTTKIQFQPVLCRSLKDKFLTQGHDLSPEKLGSHLVFLPIWIDLTDPFRHGDTTLSLNHVAPSCTLNFLCVCVCPVRTCSLSSQANGLQWERTWPFRLPSSLSAAAALPWGLSRLCAPSSLFPWVPGSPLF